MKRPLILVTAIVCVVLVLGAGGVALAIPVVARLWPRLWSHVPTSRRP